MPLILAFLNFIFGPSSDRCELSDNLAKRKQLIDDSSPMPVIDRIGGDTLKVDRLLLHL